MKSKTTSLCIPGGFTLVELLVVITVIIVLVALGLVGLRFIAKYSGRFQWQGSAAVEGYENGKIAYRYGGKALVAYFDGHVGEVTPEDMKQFRQAGWHQERVLECKCGLRWPKWK